MSADDEGMDLLINFAESVPGARDELFVSPILEEDQQEQILKLSSQVVALTTRISELSSDKLKLEFENRDLRSRSAPASIELSAVREENELLKSQLQGLWGEIENVSKQKTDLFKDRCESTRRLSDEIALLKSELSAEQHKASLAEAEKDRYRQQALTQIAEARAREEAARVEHAALEEKLARQEHLIGVLDKQGSVNSKIEHKLEKIEKELKDTKLALVDAQNECSSVQEQLNAVKEEKEDLLKKLVSQKDNKKAHATVDALLGPGWNLSDLVDSLAAAKRDVAAKREEIGSLHKLVEDMQRKMPSVEANFAALQRAEAELADLRAYNEQISGEFERREDFIDQLRFEKEKLETALAAAKLRASEYGKNLATVMHENESLRNRVGVHAGAGRSHPALVAASEIRRTSLHEAMSDDESGGKSAVA